eukprot:jgi/Picsp_1/6794/NSC_04133-R1_protein
MLFEARKKQGISKHMPLFGSPVGSKHTGHQNQITCNAMFGSSSVNSKFEYKDAKGEKRGDYEYQDADDYFCCSGLLAAEGTYDRLEAWTDAGVHPIDMILIMACVENDGPKVEEVLDAGAQASVKDPRDGNTPVELCTDPDIKAMLEKFGA